MPTLTRKAFLQKSAVLCAGLLAKPSLALQPSKLSLAFSTLGCPDWTFRQIIDFAVQHGYSGIEMRGLQRQMDLAQSPEFNTEESRKKTRDQMKVKGLQFVNLGASPVLHLPEGEDREKSLASGRQFIDLAQQIACPYVRVFPNLFPKEQEKAATIDLMAKGLLTLGDYARNKNVTVLMETHGDAVYINDLKTIMQAAAHSNVGLVWDVANMWTITKESPTKAYEELKNYIHHTHIKDAAMVDGKLQYTFLGHGEVPIFEAIDVLEKGGYKGYYSFEWEKLWHPELADPELALADYPKAMKKQFGLL